MRKKLLPLAAGPRGAGKNDADKAFEDAKQAVKDAEELIELSQKGLN